MNSINSDETQRFQSLLKFTPLSAIQTIAAWSSLDFKHKLFFFDQIGNYTINEQLNILSHILDDENGYIRFLAAQSYYKYHSYNNHNYQKFYVKTLENIKEKIDADSNLLVKCAKYTNTFAWNSGIGKQTISPPAFFELERPARLLIIQNSAGSFSCANDTEFTDFIDFGLNLLAENKIDFSELDGYLREIIKSDNFQDAIKYAKIDTEGLHWHNTYKGLQNIWKLGIKHPGFYYTLFSLMPAGDEAFSDNLIEDEVLQHIIESIETKNLSPTSLIEFLSRKDVKYIEFRKKIFFAKSKEYIFCKTAACRYNFKISYQELLDIVTNIGKNDNSQQQALLEIKALSHATDLNSLAIYSLLKIIYKKYASNDFPIHFNYFHIHFNYENINTQIELLTEKLEQFHDLKKLKYNRQILEHGLIDTIRYRMEYKRLNNGSFFPIEDIENSEVVRYLDNLMRTDTPYYQIFLQLLAGYPEAVYDNTLQKYISYNEKYDIEEIEITDQQKLSKIISELCDNLMIKLRKELIFMIITMTIVIKILL